MYGRTAVRPYNVAYNQKICVSKIRELVQCQVMIFVINFLAISPDGKTIFSAIPHTQPNYELPLTALAKIPKILFTFDK
jgi:hypothetical protein